MCLLKWFITSRSLCCTIPQFENLDFPNHVFKLQKALYGLKQAPRAWYELLSKFLLENGFRHGQVDKTRFIEIRGRILSLYKSMFMI